MKVGDLVRIRLDFWRTTERGKVGIVTGAFPVEMLKNDTPMYWRVNFEGSNRLIEPQEVEALSASR